MFLLYFAGSFGRCPGRWAWGAIASIEHLTWRLPYGDNLQFLAFFRACRVYDSIYIFVNKIFLFPKLSVSVCSAVSNSFITKGIRAKSSGVRSAWPRFASFWPWFFLIWRTSLSVKKTVSISLPNKKGARHHLRIFVFFPKFYVILTYKMSIMCR
jgi:hypothetical protein